MFMCIHMSFMCIGASFCIIAMLLFFPSKPCRILQDRQNFASLNFCLGSRERFGAEQNQIPEFPNAYSVRSRTSAHMSNAQQMFILWLCSKQRALLCAYLYHLVTMTIIRCAIAGPGTIYVCTFRQ
jgi:hypothetical protein